MCRACFPMSRGAPQACRHRPGLRDGRCCTNSFAAARRQLVTVPCCAPGAPSGPAAFGVRIAARAGFHLAGAAMQVVAHVLADNQAVFAGIGDAPGVTYADRLSDLSFGQLIETLPPAVDATALRRHYELVAGARPARCSGCRAPTAARRAAPTRPAASPDAVRRPARACLPDHGRRPRHRRRPELGKDACGDLDRRVPTWPVIEWLAMRPGARELWLSAETSSATLQTDLVESGATQAARVVAVQATETASAALDIFPSTPARADLRELLQQVINR
uniref:Wt7.4 n=1 Tax=Nocardia sp. WT7 TaxID=1178024 RepID=I1WDZ4_9NOCA|nr:Wt7.4 [Nocardia sp. WT7]